MVKRRYVKKLNENMLKPKKPNTQFGKIQNPNIIPEEIPYRVMHTQNKRNSISFKDIKICPHAKQVASQRLHINSERELQKLGGIVKRNGLNLVLVNSTNYETYGLSYEHYKWLKDKYYHFNSDYVYFHKGYFFIFTGRHNNTLRTIIYPGLPISAEKPSSGDEVIDRFFADIRETQFHNIECKAGI